VTRLVRTDPGLAIEHADVETVVAQRQLPCRSEADDAGADDEDVALAWRLGRGVHRRRS
jgi:hypothetical protein